MKPVRVFLDANVVLDHLADRQPFAVYAHQLLALAEARLIEAHVSALTFCNLYYLLRKFRGHQSAIEALHRLSQLVRITMVGEPEIRSGLVSGHRDFEDAVQLASAEAQPDLEVILTRNPRDFPVRRLAVQSPDQFLADRRWWG